MKGTRNRRKTQAGSLRGRFESNICTIKETVWQNEKYFTLEVHVNLKNNHVHGKRKKADIPEENLLKQDAQKSQGIWCDFMVCCNQVFFVNSNGIKTNKSLTSA